MMLCYPLSLQCGFLAGSPIVSCRLSCMFVSLTGGGGDVYGRRGVKGDGRGRG